MKYLSENAHYLMRAVLTEEIAQTFIRKKCISMITISASRKGSISIVLNTLKLNWNVILTSAAQC